MTEDTNTRTITACPDEDCGSPNISLRRPGKGNGSIPATEPRYYCNACGNRFQYPAEKETKQGHTTSGLSNQLDKIDDWDTFKARCE